MVDYFNIIRILVSAYADVLAVIPVAVRLLYCLKGVKMEGFSLRDMMFIIVSNSALSFDNFGCDSKNCRHIKIMAVLVLCQLHWSVLVVYTTHTFFFNLQQKCRYNVTAKLNTAQWMHVEEWIGTACYDLCHQGSSHIWLPVLLKILTTFSCENYCVQWHIILNE